MSHWVSRSPENSRHPGGKGVGVFLDDLRVPAGAETKGSKGFPFALNASKKVDDGFEDECEVDRGMVFSVGVRGLGAPDTSALSKRRHVAALQTSQAPQGKSAHHLNFLVHKKRELPQTALAFKWIKAASAKEEVPVCPGLFSRLIFGRPIP